MAIVDPAPTPAPSIADAPLSLDDKYTKLSGKVFASGVQVLVRLPMAQMRRDRAAGLNTAAFVSGYRGSPLAGYDSALIAAKRHLDPYNILVRPGVNEELAATAVWGTQQLGLSPGARYDGVTGIWYGKGPGVDRCGDVFKHANAAGTAKHGGVLCLAGDDHGAKSSTLPHQSDHAFAAALIPVLYPASIHEFLDYGLLGIAMSRYSGCWVGMKVIADSVETSSVIDLGAETREFVLPTDFEMPPTGLNIRFPDDRWTQDHRLQVYKAYAALAFARANRLDRVVIDSASPRFGIVASGKAYEDVRQALRELGIDAEVADRLGLRVYKVGMPWPLEPQGIRAFAEGLDEVLIVEERREMVENQIKQALFNWHAHLRPRIVGKFDEDERPVLPLDHELSVGLVARILWERLRRLEIAPDLRQHLEARVAYFERRQREIAAYTAPATRLPTFCSGCPHNKSTALPEGSRAIAGIGCHFMVQWMDRSSDTCTQMGGEGVPWVGLAPFTDEPHIFANLGDGTYFHSGILAIRQAVAAGVNITYKILYNDAVAMTGGQSVDGALSVPEITHQLFQEGVAKIYLLSEAPDAYSGSELAPGTVIRPREDLDQVMRELREVPGCTAIVYEEVCRAERRRRLKRASAKTVPTRVMINPEVCEGCGDCSVQSNCISIEPLETAFGRKRQINQSSCNTDLSCLRGFCPSFVTVEGATLRRQAAVAIDPAELPPPARQPALDRPYGIAVAGIGGTGVLTIGALLGVAAHIDGLAVMILDQSGLAQKGGAVLSHIQFARTAEEIRAPRIATGGADLLVAADGVVAAMRDCVELCEPARTTAIVNRHLAPTSDFARNRDFDFHQHKVLDAVRSATRPAAFLEDFTGTAEAAIGDSIASNIMMLGYAFQCGLLPVSLAALEHAIVLNKVAVNSNQQAFAWGRLLAADPARAGAVLGDTGAAVETPEAMTLDRLIQHRAQFLEAYQNAALAERYRKLVERVRQAAAREGLGDALPRAVARYYAKLLAYKDEYEVARLFTTPEFRRRIETTFEGGYKLAFHLAPPFMGGPVGPDGRPKKQRFGARAVWPLFGLLARLKGLRGTAFDVFGYSAERREERRLIADYEAAIERLLPVLNRSNGEAAVALARLPDQIRGYGPVKAAAIAKARVSEAAIWAEFERPAMAEAAE